MDEETLIEGLENNDETALRELYQQYKDRVYAVVRSNVDSDWDAEEVTQDVMWKVYTKIDTFRGNSALWSWMYRIAVNEARMKTRKYKRHPVPMKDDTLTAMINNDDSEESELPTDRVALKDVLEEVEEYLEESTDMNETVFVDLELDGQSKEDVAEALDLSVSAVKARLHRMRVGLRERIRENYLQELERV
jgi:RNA polymerase sigma-70 factor (ECF subfamily)